MKEIQSESQRMARQLQIRYSHDCDIAIKSDLEVHILTINVVFFQCAISQTEAALSKGVPQSSQHRSTAGKTEFQANSQSRCCN